MLSRISGLLFFTVIAFTLCTIPDFITVCQRNDPDLAGCINNSIELLKPRLKEGIEELGIPPLKELALGDVHIDRLGGGTGLQTNLSNIIVYGAPDFKILKLVPSLRKTGNIFQFDVIIPKVYAEGKYELDSKILFLNLKGSGKFTANITDYSFVCLLKGKLVKEENVNHIIFQNMECDAVFANANIFLSNLFNGQELLERATNAAINDNINLLFEEIKPNLLGALAARFTEIANKITRAFTAEELFP